MTDDDAVRQFRRASSTRTSSAATMQASSEDIEKQQEVQANKQHDGNAEASAGAAAEGAPAFTSSHDPEKAHATHPASSLSTPSRDASPASSPVTQEAQESDEGFPEGGLRAWSVVVGTATVMAFSFGYLNAFGVFQTFYATSFLQGYSQSDIAWIGALQYFFIFSVGIFAGRAFDLGLFKPLMAFAILLAAFSQMMLSLCTTYYQLILAQGVGLGIAMGLIFNLAVSIPTHWFKRRRATALGVSATGSSIGGVIFPILLQRLLPEIGFPWTMRLIGFGYVLLVGGAWFLMDTRLPPVEDVRNGGWRKVHWFEPSAFRKASYTCFVFGTLACLFGLYTPFVYMDLFTETYRIPASGYWISILNASSTFGRVIPGILGDRYGRINTLLPHLALAVIFLFIFPLFTNLSLIAFTIIYGYCSGCFVSIIAPCVAQLGSTNTIGTRLGMMFAIMSIGGLLGTPISGFILGNNAPYRWWATAGYSGGAVALGLVFTILSRYFAVDGKVRAKI